MNQYHPAKIEKKWQKYWEKNKTFKTSDSSDRPKFYVLDMFPYPSGAGLHVGHPKGYIATDIVARMKMMQGHNVLHPMGWDAFGLPAENYALKNKMHPAESTEKNVQVFKKQLGLLGFTYDWDREVNTTDPEYYRWTQWMFIEMYKRGLVFESNEPINWCPSCKTGLANEDLDDGKCERCGSIVEQKPMRQWVIKITDYAERLLNDIDKLTEWPEPIKEMQRNWIGKSEGALVKFAVIPTEAQGRAEESLSIEVFTTRPDTLFGCTYCVVAPEHELLRNQKFNIKNQKEVNEYIANAKNKTVMERTELAKEKTGIEIQGIKAVNPANGEQVPIFVADYVLGNYGTGAIMAVPAHDERDWEFAKKYDLPIRCVVIPDAYSVESASKPFSDNFQKDQDVEMTKILLGEKCNVSGGISTNSDFLNGLKTPEAKQKMITWLEEKNIGKKKTQYKLRDWVFSRQRYWGEPIPLVKCEACANKKFNYILIHGFTSNSSRGFKPWLKTELEKDGHRVWNPDLPNTTNPNVNEQAKYVLENSPFSIDEDTVLVGHSLGGPVTYRILESINKKIARTVLVDPVVRPRFNDQDRPEVVASCDWQFDWKKIKINGGKIVVLGDIHRPIIKKEHLVELEKNLGADLWWVIPQNYHFSSRGGAVESEPAVLRASIDSGWSVVDDEELPLELPKVKHYEPSGTGESPLATIEKWVNTKCPKCSGPAKRETNTMPQWAGSSWYYLAYAMPRVKGKYIWDKKVIEYWIGSGLAPRSPSEAQGEGGVDFYVGGAEHATRHLIYARFWHKFLFDIGMVAHDEPFKRLQNLGVILAEDGRKMSKRWNNVINPNDIVARFGADAMRVYEMFMGPFDQPCAWNMQGVVGAKRFLEKVWDLFPRLDKNFTADASVGIMHKTIKKVTEDISEMKFNTAISQLMIWVNELRAQEKTSFDELKNLTLLLAPFAPHLCEELWEMLDQKSSVVNADWPKYNPAKIQDNEITLAIQVNGKLRDTIVVPFDISDTDAKDRALASEKVQKWLEGRAPKKVIYVKGKLVSIVA
ncbi:MAG: leucine--tRNA ligase [Candidatus Magasanikbacteria bacterium]|jgi:leucyl-tRNA synthetase